MQTAVYLGTTYRQQYAYKARTTYVAGEFYWPVERGHATFNRDYAGGHGALLAMEETPRERTWSVGSKVDSDLVARAFGLEAKAGLMKRGDAGPTSGKGAGCGCATIVLVVLAILILLALLKACEDDNWTRGSGTGYTSSPRSGGGYSGGGGWSGGGK
jgi:hypothetical protein